MALSSIQPWHYFHASDQAAALAALRARMGATFASSPVDADLLVVLARAVEHLHRATGRFFLVRSGALEVDGLGGKRLDLPHPVVSTDQGGTGVTAIRIAGDESDLPDEVYTVNDGAGWGTEDPRDDPYVLIQPPVSAVAWDPGTSSKWPRRVRGVTVTAEWGYVEEDGSTPELVLHALARLCVLNAVDGDDYDGQEDKRRGALLIEQTRGRMTQLQRHAAGTGVTTDREIDGILRRYRRPSSAALFMA